MATSLVQPPTSDGINEMSRVVQLIFGLYMVALNVVIVYLLVVIWPDKTPLPDAPESISAFFGRVQFVLSPEVRLLLITILTGALGSYIHAATSFVDFIGNRQFVKSWTWWYLLRPFIGVALALLVYFATRGGLIAGSTGANGINPYGIAALSGMAGLFSKQATDKLREVFETLFKTDHPPPRSDKLTN